MLLGVVEMIKSPSAKKIKAALDREKRFGCGVCVVACDPGALTMKLHPEQARVRRYASDSAVAVR